MIIENYSDRNHRTQVIALWERVFGYQQKRNEPNSVIDKKLAVHDGLFFVAMVDKRLVGTVMAGYDGHRGWIYSLAVSPESRGKQWGSELMQHAEEELRKQGCIKVNLQILDSNEKVRIFYEKNGYSEEPRISMGKILTE
ncbi:MAG: GNAT family acetyltransferase [Spirochaetaceae bacterium]|jgi:ribosomal protein S18 acetylase RimI-like enzyme|nr:GNAT family acetyltransferase [Spirochaetaceae bacterium]